MRAESKVLRRYRPLIHPTASKEQVLREVEKVTQTLRNRFGSLKRRAAQQGVGVAFAFSEFEEEVVSWMAVLGYGTNLDELRITFDRPALEDYHLKHMEILTKKEAEKKTQEKRERRRKLERYMRLPLAPPGSDEGVTVLWPHKELGLPLELYPEFLIELGMRLGRDENETIEQAVLKAAFSIKEQRGHYDNDI